VCLSGSDVKMSGCLSIVDILIITPLLFPIFSVKKRDDGALSDDEEDGGEEYDTRSEAGSRSRTSSISSSDVGSRSASSGEEIGIFRVKYSLTKTGFSQNSMKN